MSADEYDPLAELAADSGDPEQTDEYYDPDDVPEGEVVDENDEPVQDVTEPTPAAAQITAEEQAESPPEDAPPAVEPLLSEQLAETTPESVPHEPLPVAEPEDVQADEPEAQSSPVAVKVKKEKKKREYIHVPFDQMECPIEGCTVSGSVPGVKRHVGFMHKDAHPEFPPTRTVDNLAGWLDEDEERAHALVDSLGLTETCAAIFDSPEASWEDIAQTILNHINKT